jgi:hypothetical protein
MESFKSFLSNSSWLSFLEGVTDIVGLDQEEFVETCTKFITTDVLNESANSTRYSVEVNYNTDQKDFLKGYAKIALGYVSAALKKHNYHCRLVFSEEPYRIIVSARSWDDGEPVGMITYNADHNFFVFSKGHYNKLKKTVVLTDKSKIDGQVTPQKMTSKIKHSVDEMKHKVLSAPDKSSHPTKGPKT